MSKALPQKSDQTLSFTPGISPVTSSKLQHHNRLALAVKAQKLLSNRKLSTEAALKTVETVTRFSSALFAPG